jgi:uncharacterized protein
MSEQNAGIVRGMYEAFGRGDIATVMGALAPDIEWMEAENFIYDDGNPYIGPNAVLEGVFMRIGVDWEGFVVAPLDVHDAGETIIGRGYYSGTYKKNGKQVRAQFAHVFTFKDGKVAKFQQYTDTAQFREATVS